MSCLWPWRLSLLTRVLNDWLSCMWITCCCWPHCCRFLETVSWGRWVEGSRSQLWPIASGKDLHLSSAGRSAEDCQLLQKETGVKQLVRLVEDRSERELTPPIGSGLTDAVFGKRDVPLRWSALLLSFRAAAVSQLWRFGEKGRPPVLQLSVYCEKHAKTTKVIPWKVPLSCLLALVDPTLRIGWFLFSMLHDAMQSFTFIIWLNFGTAYSCYFYFLVISKTDTWNLCLYKGIKETFNIL